MELKVWVEGIQRIVCGVTESTTCHDVVYALAHATGKTGRFTLVERWRHNERLLSPHEYPLRVLAKWGEYSSDVQFILRQTVTSGAKSPSPAAPVTGGVGKTTSSSGSRTPDFLLSFSPTGIGTSPDGAVATVNGTSKPHSSSGGRESIKKSLTFSGASHSGELSIRDSSRDRERSTKGELLTGRSNHVESESRDIGHVFVSVEHPNEQDVHSTSPKRSERTDALVHITDGRPRPNGEVTLAVGNECSTSQSQRGIGHTDPLTSAGAQHPQKQVVGRKKWQSPQGGTKSPPRGPLPLVQSPPVVPPSGYHNNRNTNAPQPHQPPRPPPYPDPPSYPFPKSSDRTEIQPKTQHRSLSPSQQQQQQQRSSVSPGRQILHSPDPGSPNSSPGSPPSFGGTGSSGRQSFNLGTPKSRRNLLSEFNRHDLEEEFTEEAVLRGEGLRSTVLSEKSRERERRKGKPEEDIRRVELVRLVNLQRERLDSQQAEMTHFDAEIMYWEEKQREHQRQIQYMEKEMRRLEFSGRDNEEEATQLDKRHLDEEMEIGWQQEKTLASELTLLRSKLANCETELLQCKNKIRSLLDDISDEKKRLSHEEKERKDRELEMLSEIEALQRLIKEKIKDYETKVESSEQLDCEVKLLENAIAEKKKQVEELVREMKAANLESLAFTPSEEIRHVLEGSCHKGPGSGRKIVGSPRQLENAVPTSKNPHGVWV